MCREQALLRQLLDNPALSRRSISAHAFSGVTSSKVSPLVSSMAIAARRDCSEERMDSAEFTFIPGVPLISSGAGEHPAKASRKTCRCKI